MTKGIKGFQKGHQVNKGKIPWNKNTKGICKANLGSFKKGNNNWLGKHHSIETKKKIGKAHKGIKSSDSTRKKMSKAHLKNPVKYWLGKKHSVEYKRKMSKSLTGRVVSKEHKRKMSEANKGEKNPMYGKTGNKNPAWKGGISFEPYSIDWTETLRRAIRERDHYLCQACSQYGNTVHHIDYDKKNCNPDNLITTCISCNSKANFNRKKWIDYFTN